MARLKHPGIVSVTESFVESGLTRSATLANRGHPRRALRLLVGIRP